MAAGIRANEEQPDGHKIDCSGVVSKYVGETDKRFNKILLKAWPHNLMLFIDGTGVLSGQSINGKGSAGLVRQQA